MIAWEHLEIGGHGLHQHIKNALKPLASVLLPGARERNSVAAKEAL